MRPWRGFECVGIRDRTGRGVLKILVTGDVAISYNGFGDRMENS
jgi:hypothetical protein